MIREITKTLGLSAATLENVTAKGKVMVRIDGWSHSVLKR